jgi:lysophospholipase L1-like esterase
MSDSRVRKTISLAALIALLIVIGILAARVWGSEDSPVIPVPQKAWETRHREKVAAVQAAKYNLLLIGDSITHNLDLPPYKAVWDQFYGSRHALNLGYSGARTENILWNLQNGELDGQSPKVAVLLIGTNNSDGANFPVAHTPKQIAQGTQAIVELLRRRLPQTKIVLLRIFPRAIVFDNDNSKSNALRRSTTIQQASEIVARLADDKTVYYLDINHVFLRKDGSIDPELMPDLLHPSPLGALAWAKAMEPTLSKLMSDRRRDYD